MADDKDKPAFDTTVLEELTFLLAGLVVLAVLVNRFLAYLDSLGGPNNLWERLLSLLGPYWAIWKVIALILTAACLLWATYSYRKLSAVVKEEKQIYPPIVNESLIEELTDKVESEKANEKWLQVQKLTNSDNAADWRLAVLEADIMLDEALRLAGFVGDGVGERLKSLDQSDLLTLQNAWDGHKVRNQIAHGGTDFQLTERETRRVIAQFEAVFRELQII